MSDSTTARARREAAEERAATYFHREFREKLARVPTLAAARAVADETLPAGHPGQRYHDRLREFLDDLGVPARSTLPERLMYMTVARRVSAAGEIDEQALAEIEERFRRASPPPR